MKVPTTTQEIVAWILMSALALCFAGLIFFVRRFIQHNDDHHKKVDEKLGSLSSKAEENGRQVTQAVNRVNESAVKIEQSALEFQKEINKEIHEVHKATTQVKADVATIQNAVVGLQDTVIKHQHSLSLGAKAMVKTREEVDGIKTKITKISETLVIIGTKKKGEGA